MTPTTVDVGSLPREEIDDRVIEVEPTERLHHGVERHQIVRPGARRERPDRAQATAVAAATVGYCIVNSRTRLISPMSVVCVAASRGWYGDVGC